tara:strand:+ start:3234 stop:3602 length:369 start_codon:yes stop_codon:yes gene_type:complete
MRVRLSYTTEVEEVLKETALLFGNLSHTIEEAIKTYNDITTNLKDDEFNPKTFHEDVSKFRQNLAKIDIRSLELEEIITGYSDYHRAPQEFLPETLQEPEISEMVNESSPFVATEESEVMDD